MYAEAIYNYTEVDSSKASFNYYNNFKNIIIDIINNFYSIDESLTKLSKSDIQYESDFVNIMENIQNILKETDNNISIKYYSMDEVIVFIKSNTHPGRYMQIEFSIDFTSINDNTSRSSINEGIIIRLYEQEKDNNISSIINSISNIAEFINSCLINKKLASSFDSILYLIDGNIKYNSKYGYTNFELKEFNIKANIDKEGINQYRVTNLEFFKTNMMEKNNNE